MRPGAFMFKIKHYAKPRAPPRLRAAEGPATAAGGRRLRERCRRRRWPQGQSERSRKSEGGLGGRHARGRGREGPGAGGAAWPALRPNARKRAGGAGAVAGCIAIAAGSVRTATLATGAKRALVEWWGARRPPHARLRARGAGLGWQRKDSPGHRGEAEAAAWAGLPGDGATQPESGPTGANGRSARPGWAREAGTAEAIRGESQASRPPRA